MNTYDILNNTKVDIYEKAKKSDHPWYTTTLMDFLVTKSKQYKAKIMYLRDINAQDEKRAKQYKADKLLCCTVSCSGIKRRVVGEVKKDNYTGIIAIDIDHDDNPFIDVEKAKQDVMRFPFVMLAMKSCRGTGIFCLIKYNKELRFTQVFNSLKDEFKSIGYNIDKSCSDPVRLRYISYDDNILIHSEVTEYNKAKEEEVNEYVYNGDSWDLTKDDVRSISTIIYVLVNYNNYTVDDYDEWLYEGFRLATIPDYNVGLSLFQMISENSDNYDGPEDVEEKFKECRRTTDNTTNVLGYYINKVKEIYGPEWKSIINNILRKDKK